MLVVSNDWAASADGEIFHHAGNSRETAIDAVENGNFFDADDLIDENGQRYFYIGRTSYFVPEVDEERVIEDIVEQCANTIEDSIDDYLDNVPNKWLDELRCELTKVFVDWEKKHNLRCNRFVVEDEYVERINL